MLIEMNLRNLLQPATLLETFELEALCRKYMPLDTDWEVVDGLINVTGPFELKSFVQDGKLIAPFGTVTTMMLNAGSVRSLVGFPKIVHGIVDIRSGWLESLEGCPEQADSIYVQAHHLKSLEHGPKRAPFYGISSESVVSLAGVSKHGIGTLSVSGCNSIKTTDGLDGVTLDALSLPPDIHEITEYPVSCKELTYPICAGFPRLFLAEGLTTMTVGDVNKSKISKAVIAKVDDICKQVLEVTGNKRRYLRAQTLLIDADLEELL